MKGNLNYVFLMCEFWCEKLDPSVSPYQSPPPPPPTPPPPPPPSQRTPLATWQQSCDALALCVCGQQQFLIRNIMPLTLCSVVSRYMCM
jgi:hypothetical protein